MWAKYRDERADNEFPEGKFPDRKPLSDYLAVTRTLCMLPVVVSVAVIQNTFAGDRRKRYSDVFSETVMGHCYKSSTLRQLRILTLVKPLRVELNNVIYRFVAWGLPNYNKLFPGSGFNARWISEVPDRQKDDVVILYLHGGGYALKMCQPQIQYICELAKALLPYRVSILALDYTITPFFQYPSQLKEGLACVKTLQSQCDRVILMGDSCGGNLALSLLLSEEQVKPLSVYGLVLISPWTDPGAQDGSMNSTLDILSKERLNEMLKNYVNPKLLDNPLVSPIKADGPTWRRLLPKRTVMVWGADECLADQCAQWAEIAQVDRFFVEPNGTHDCILRGMSPEPSRFVTDSLIQWSSEKHDSQGPRWASYSDDLQDSLHSKSIVVSESETHHSAPSDDDS